MAQAEHPAERPLLQQHLWVALALLICALAAYATVAPGNVHHSDEWSHLVTAEAGAPGYIGNRPLSMSLLTLTEPLGAALPVISRLYLIAERFAIAFALYLLLRALRPADPHFALAAAALAILTPYRDEMTLVQFSFTAEAQGFIVVSLLALAAQAEASARPGWLPNLISMGLAVVAILMRELALPVLMSLPVLWTLANRRFDRVRLLWLGAFLLVCGLTSLWYLAPLLGLAGSSYGSGLFVREYASLGHFIIWTPVQFINLYQPLLLLVIDPAALKPLWMGALAALAGLALAWGLAAPRLACPAERRPAQPRPLISSLLFAAGGLIASFLAFAPFLLTPYGLYAARVHFFSQAGMAVTLAAIAWLPRALMRPGQRWEALSLSLLGLIALLGGLVTAQIGGSYRSWLSIAQFWRGMANQVPAMQPDSALLLSIDYTDLRQPFYYGWTFQNGTAYLSGHTLHGISDGNLYGQNLTLAPEGAVVTVNPGAEDWAGVEPAIYGWDRLIFLAVDEEGRPGFRWEQVDARYRNPYSEAGYDPRPLVIVQAWVPEMMQLLMPPVRDPSSP